MKKTLLTVLQYVIFLGLGVAIIVYMSHQLSAKDKAEMLEAIKSVRLWMAIPIFFVGFLSHFFRALRWKLLLEPMNIHPSTTNTTFAVLIGYLANLMLPRAGEVAKCTVLARYEKVPADKMIGTIVAERAFDVVCLILVTITAFTLQAHIIGNYASDLMSKAAGKRNAVFIALAIVALLIVGLVFVYRRNKESRVGKFIKGLSDGVRSIAHMKKRGRFLIFTTLIWLMYLTQIYLGFLSLPATQHLNGLAALVVLIFGSIGMIATQGGIGAYTYLVQTILLAYGVAKTDGLAFGWIAWAVQTGIICVLGIASLILLPIYNRNRYEQIRVDTK